MSIKSILTLSVLKIIEAIPAEEVDARVKSLTPSQGTLVKSILSKYGKPGSDLSAARTEYYNLDDIHGIQKALNTQQLHSVAWLEQLKSTSRAVRKFQDMMKKHSMEAKLNNQDRKSRLPSPAGDDLNTNAIDPRIETMKAKNDSLKNSMENWKHLKDVFTKLAEKFDPALLEKEKARFPKHNAGLNKRLAHLDVLVRQGGPQSNEALHRYLLYLIRLCEKKQAEITEHDASFELIKTADGKLQENLENAYQKELKDKLILFYNDLFYHDPQHGVEHKPLKATVEKWKTDPMIAYLYRSKLGEIEDNLGKVSDTPTKVANKMLTDLTARIDGYAPPPRDSSAEIQPHSSSSSSSSSSSLPSAFSSAVCYTASSAAVSSSASMFASVQVSLAPAPPKLPVFEQFRPTTPEHRKDIVTILEVLNSYETRYDPAFRYKKKFNVEKFKKDWAEWGNNSLVPRNMIKTPEVWAELEKDNNRMEFFLSNPDLTTKQLLHAEMEAWIAKWNAKLQLPPAPAPEPEHAPVSMSVSSSSSSTSASSSSSAPASAVVANLHEDFAKMMSDAVGSSIVPQIKPPLSQQSLSAIEAYLEEDARAHSSRALPPLQQHYVRGMQDVIDRYREFSEMALDILFERYNDWFVQSRRAYKELFTNNDAEAITNLYCKFRDKPEQLQAELHSFFLRAIPKWEKELKDLQTGQKVIKESNMEVELPKPKESRWWWQRVLDSRRWGAFESALENPNPKGLKFFQLKDNENSFRKYNQFKELQQNSADPNAVVQLKELENSAIKGSDLDLTRSFSVDINGHVYKSAPAFREALIKLNVKPQTVYILEDLAQQGSYMPVMIDMLSIADLATRMIPPPNGSQYYIRHNKITPHHLKITVEGDNIALSVNPTEDLALQSGDLATSLYRFNYDYTLKIVDGQDDFDMVIDRKMTRL